MLSSVPGIGNLPTPVIYLIAFAIIFALLCIFALVLRRLTGGRVIMNGERGRARQPRLGIVDVYDLDRQRQLILLRRDNVEHLLLVGGPNDVVIETNIVRVPGARLPATADAPERVDAAPERPAEIAPPRPVVEPSSQRPAATRAPEPAVAGHLGRVETAVASVASRVTPARPEPARPAAPPPAARLPDRTRATPTGAPPRAEPAGTTRPAPAPRPIPAAAAAPASEDASPSPRAPLADMARQLEDVLRRPEPPAAPPPAPEPARPARPVRPTFDEERKARAEARAALDVKPAQTPVLAAVPASPPPPAPEIANEDVPPPPRPNGASEDLPASPEARVDAPAAEPPPPTPAPTPQAEVAASRPEPAPTPPAPAASPPPPSPPARPDPFSIEDIEAEFARLLGRPLDRRDGQS